MDQETKELILKCAALICKHITINAMNLSQNKRQVEEIEKDGQKIMEQLKELKQKC